MKQSHQLGRSIRAACGVVFIASLLAPCGLAARDIAVAPGGNDAAAGTVAAPYLTLAKALTEAKAGDTIRLAAGEYDCAGFSAKIDRALTITGAGKDTTVLKNLAWLEFTESLRVSGLAFTDSRGPVLKPSAAEGKSLRDVLIEDCAFLRVWQCISTGDGSLGEITNVTVRNCEFKDLKGEKVYGIAITSGIISKITIADNRFQNLESTRKICSAITVGGNSTRDTTREVVISGNHMADIKGPLTDARGDGVETHGILAYGEGIKILKNDIKRVNHGGNHEPIYTKVSNSLIEGNVIEECSSGQGDIAAKGGERAGHNIIKDNQIFGQGKGRGIYAHGGVIVEGNYIKKPNGEVGIRLYANKEPVVVRGNYVESPQNAVRINDGVPVTITGNTLVSYNEAAINLVGASKLDKNEGNKTHKGPTPPGWDPRR